MPPYRSGRLRATLLCLLAPLFFLGALPAQDKSPLPKGAKGKKKGPEKNEESLNTVPLAVGHEARGLVLPDYDASGKLRTRFEAGVVRRLDENRIQLLDLKMNSFPEKDEEELEIRMSDSVFDLQSRVLTSEGRTIVKRSDFEIAGDKMRFDTKTRQGTLVGDVKMVIVSRGDGLLQRKGR